MFLKLKEKSLIKEMRICQIFKVAKQASKELQSGYICARISWGTAKHTDF